MVLFGCDIPNIIIGGTPLPNGNILYSGWLRTRSRVDIEREITRMRNGIGAYIMNKGWT